MAKMKQLIVFAAIMCGLSGSGIAFASKLVDQSGSADPIGSRSLLSPAKIDERTKPDSQVCLQGEDCGEAAPVAEAADAAPKSPEEIYTASCSACHGAGVLGAPKFGDSGEWAPRIAQGKDTLYEHAIKGFNSMPPMGSCGGCSEDDIKAVVDYMVAEAE